MPSPAREIRDRLRLLPHPEGGAYREVFRSPAIVSHPLTAAPRNAATAIYYLLEAGDFSAFHRVCSDETWHLYDGGPLELHLIDGNGDHRMVLLGADVIAGQVPQFTIPAGTLQAARPAPQAPHALCGCTVAPGFDFADFEMPPRRDLLAAHPGLAEIIHALTRGDAPPAGK